MKTTPRRLLRVIVLVGSLACGRDNARVRGEAGGEAALANRDSRNSDEAMVRVVNAIPGEGPIDVFAGEQRAFSAVAFRGTTEYARVTPNTPTFFIARAGDSTADALGEEMALTRDGHLYTVVAMGAVDSGRAEVEVLRDDYEPGDSTKALLRIVNAAAGSGELDIFLGADETPYFDDLDVRDDDGYRELDPGTVTLTVRPDDQRTVLLRLPNVSLKAGQRLTLVLARATPRGDRLSAIRLRDEGAEPKAVREHGR